MKYLITGRDGQLAKAFIERFTLDGTDYLAPLEKDLDITNQSIVDKICSEYRPDVILNCAAYNQVDQAEINRALAFSVNATGPLILAKHASKYNALIVHFSSDYVFDGMKGDGLYTELDTPCPLNYYGFTKSMSEGLVKVQSEDHLILRLSWVFGDGPQNFICKFLDYSKNESILEAPYDEFSVPTYTKTVVDVTLKAIDRKLRGLYHLTNSGYCSRFELARFILDELGINRFILPVDLDSFRTRADRPGFSAMSNKKISTELGIKIPHWEDSVKDYLGI